jgi:hypothetical protein
MSAYIDLNPVRAGMVEDPADYRCRHYGEAVGRGFALVAAFDGIGARQEIATRGGFSRRTMNRSPRDELGGTSGKYK